MKKLVKVFIVSVLSAMFFACSEDKMDTINENPNNPEDVATRLVLTDVMTSTALWVTGADYAFYASVYMELNAGTSNQMFNAEMRLGEPSASGTYNNSWNIQYRNLRNLKVVIAKCSEGGAEEGNYLNLGVAQVLSAYQLAMLTDLFGDVPWSQALQPGVFFTPKIDQQETIYNDVFKFLDDAIANFGLVTYSSLGNQDMIYKGNTALWLKAAYALKARYLMRLSHRKADYNGVLTAIGNSFANAAEELKYSYSPPDSHNPFNNFNFTSRTGYLGASLSLKEKLDVRNDPRRDLFWAVLAGTVPPEIVFASNGDVSQSTTAYSRSKLSAVVNPSSNPNPFPTYLMSYHELQFLKAEAHARLGNITEAEAALKEAIKAAFLKVRSSDNAEAYYTTDVKALFDANPLREIMMQKYLASYECEGIEAFNDYRRLRAMGQGDFILLKNPLNAQQSFPLRFSYGSSDVTTNPNVANAYGNGSYVYAENVWWAGGTR